MRLEFLFNGGGLPPAHGHGYEKCIINLSTRRASLSPRDCLLVAKMKPLKVLKAAAYSYKPHYIYTIRIVVSPPPH